eukprot:scaffold155134_cov14-Tisochrysis_lutea.AAC.1
MSPLYHQSHARHKNDKKAECADTSAGRTAARKLLPQQQQGVAVRGAAGGVAVMKNVGWTQGAKHGGNIALGLL